MKRLATTIQPLRWTTVLASSWTAQVNAVALLRSTLVAFATALVPCWTADALTSQKAIAIATETSSTLVACAVATTALAQVVLTRRLATTTVTPSWTTALAITLQRTTTVKATALLVWTATVFAAVLP
jgi:hypothetical protein